MAQLANRRLAMTLFSGDTCPYCHRVRIVLAEKGINYELQNVNLKDTPDDLKDLNPYNEVPTLVDRELVLYESNVIMEYLEEHMDQILKQEVAVLEHVVASSAAIKADIVQKDEHESDLRRILNFGHTIGHAIERCKGVLHGEAVAIGMILAARLSHVQGLLTAPELDRVEQLIKAAGLPETMELDPEEIYQDIRKDKKKSGEDIHFVLLKGLGDSLIRRIQLAELKSMIHDLC